MHALQEEELLLCALLPVALQGLKLLESRSALSADELAALMRVDAREANILLLELELEGRVVADGSKFLLSL